MSVKSRKHQKNIGEENNELIKIDDVETNLQKNDELFDEVTKSGDYLPRLQLITSSTERCKAGEFPTNHYALITGQKYEDLGAQVDFIAVDWRAKALDTSGGVTISYDPKSDSFQAIRERSAVKNSGCMYGPEFLIYIPIVEKWATFFFGSVSSRREAPVLKALLRKAVTAKSQKIVTQYTWYAPQIVPCSTPLNTPSIEEVKVQLERFNNPQENDVEVDSDNEDNGSRER